MKEERILQALGQVDEEYIEEAAPGKKSPEKRSQIKWASLAACLVIITAIGIRYFSDNRNPSSPMARPETTLLQSTAPKAEYSSAEKPDPLSLFRQHGLTAEIISESAKVSSGEEQQEIPYVRREDAVRFLKKALILDCTVEKLERIKIRVPESGRFWCITIMRLSLNRVLRGSTDEKEFSVVSASITNDPDRFLIHPEHENCEETFRAAYTLESVSESEVWTIGGAEIAVRELGDYFVTHCMDFDGESLHYRNYTIPLTELN